MSTRAWYYDNPSGPNDIPTGFVEVNRVYCLDFRRFSETEWQALSRLYEQLPGERRIGPHRLPTWFGADESTPPYLWVSVEPSGLLAHGVLRREDWKAWDTSFRQKAEALPTYEV